MIRKAKIKDVPQIVQLINHFAQQGQMLGRPLIELYEHIRSFVVAEADGKIVGCASLAVVWSDIGEIRSIAVHPDYQHRGYGRRMVEVLLNEARLLALPRVFCLTYKPEFFKKLGFRDIDKHELPHKVWRDCINCPKFPDCDEVALIIDVPENGNGNPAADSKN
ncbi:MAG: N-acetyltransferase [candidate division KSB1 bacterium]|nr:N-acetyltransferase [candidate division KSB1 bacterium]